MTTHQLSGSDFNRELTGANNFKSVDNYVNSCYLLKPCGPFVTGRNRQEILFPEIGKENLQVLEFSAEIANI
jgi:hypothetical protein